MELAVFVTRMGNDGAPGDARKIEPLHVGNPLHIARERSLGSQAPSRSLRCRRRRTINFRGGPPGDNEDLETTPGDSRGTRERKRENALEVKENSLPLTPAEACLIPVSAEEELSHGAVAREGREGHP